MSIFKSLQSSLLPRWGETPAASVTLSEVPALEVEDLIDIQFRPDSRQEDELEGRLQAVLQAQDCDPLLGGEIALAFLQTVERYYEAWTPDEDALRDTRTALARALRSGLTRPPSRCQHVGACIALEAAVEQASALFLEASDDLRLLAPGAFSRLLARIAMRCFRLLSGAGEREALGPSPEQSRAQQLLARLLAACLGAIEASYWAPLDAGSASVFRAEQPAARDVALQLLGLLASGPSLPELCLEPLVLAVGAAARCPWAAGDMVEGGLEQTLADFLGFVGTRKRVEPEAGEREKKASGFTLSRLM
ncbi:hypothetical protein H632_c959p0, partial [Helicosporidium sp. ATCC 50920]